MFSGKLATQSLVAIISAKMIMMKCNRWTRDVAPVDASSSLSSPGGTYVDAGARFVPSPVDSDPDIFPEWLCKELFEFCKIELKLERDRFL